MLMSVDVLYVLHAHPAPIPVPTAVSPPLTVKAVLLASISRLQALPHAFCALRVKPRQPLIPLHAHHVLQVAMPM